MALFSKASSADRLDFYSLWTVYLCQREGVEFGFGKMIMYVISLAGLVSIDLQKRIEYKSNF